MMEPGESPLGVARGCWHAIPIAIILWVPVCAVVLIAGRHMGWF